MQESMSNVYNAKMPEIVVQKYGGTSVGSIDRIKEIAKKIISSRETGKLIIVVVSAMGNTTNKLLDITKQISNNPSKREIDALLTTGEQQSIALLTMAIQEYGHSAISLTGFQAGINTVGDNCNSRIFEINYDKIYELLQQYKIVVVAGFQGINDLGDLTTLGRGGSDTTAVALAAKFSCPCEIYTDVNGVYTIDPNIFPSARKHEVISYDEMIEMAKLGAKVLDKRAAALAKKFDVPIYIAKSDGTEVGTFIRRRDLVEENSIVGIALRQDLISIKLSNITADEVLNVIDGFEGMGVELISVHTVLEDDEKISVFLTSTKEYTSIIEKVEDKLKKRLKGLKIKSNSNLTQLSVVGDGLKNQAEVFTKIFKTLRDNDINYKTITSTDTNITFYIKEQENYKAINSLVREFNL
ncbi:aspartate kinase [Alkaliphilus peptidifermentans]|uniref:Aspartokinase n=1 Tax=Alkaliphilus peptidifermentans DSM 18978 TaxID=1120976 RepID=A0A1G5GKB0_9FIRM|nr:aspartate kinase [Alkaliphilus peptidifermentans]SCY51924.1 aspartate kinase [Alkaliphilus peptidifermentans DSM 18978]